jgi:nicotinamide mononucleotide transporter
LAAIDPMNFFSIENIFFQILGYDLSYLEFTAVITGLIAIWLSARAHVWSWPIGIVNVTLAFFLYYQVQLYPDMFLQIFFFITNITGWWRWTHPKPFEEDRKRELQVSFLGWKKFMVLVLIGICGTALLGSMASRLHEWFPGIFPLPSAYPYVDSFIMVMSITTTFYMIEKKIESWIIWIVVDVVATYLYFIKGVKFFAFEYLVFTVIASFGLWHWYREYKSYAVRDNTST